MLAQAGRAIRFGALALAGAHAADAAPLGMDCPLARTPYATTTPVMDLLIDPRARVALDRALGGTLERMPAAFISATPPSFSAIVTPRELMGMAGVKDAPARLAELEVALKAIAPTAASIRARCARYDRVPPRLPATLKRPAILVFEKITGFRDGPSVAAARAALEAAAARRGWTLIFSDNGAIFNRRDLARFDAIVWNNVSGDALTVPQRQAFQAYLMGGGGYAGVHGSGGDPNYVWDWYADTLLGARFSGHPMNPQFQMARVAVADTTSPITKGLGQGWTMREEWYSFRTNPRTSGAHILATLDEGSYKPAGFGGQDLRMGDHPIAWTRCIGDGRSFYSAIGHRPESYTEPNSASLLEQGIAWAAGQSGPRCRDGRERR